MVQNFRGHIGGFRSNTFEASDRLAIPGALIRLTRKSPKGPNAVFVISSAPPPTRKVLFQESQEWSWEVSIAGREQKEFRTEVGSRFFHDRICLVRTSHRLGYRPLQGKLAPRAKLAPYHFFTAKTCHLGPPPDFLAVTL